ncbi:hypothetical protein AA313_de0206791 [Arthrobotrys entomopaga]|nr:hypothetical protein AA313_de0206791 [Arthrobotrys entomopaga]
MDITIDTLPQDLPQEVQEERMPALEPTMQSHGQKSVSVVEQSEVAGDLMDMQTATDPLAAHQHQHVQSVPSVGAYHGPSRLFIPTYIPDTAYQETNDVTELAGEDNPEPQIPQFDMPQNGFVMPPRPVPRNGPRGSVGMSPSAIAFKPGGMSSSALPLENPLFHLRQAAIKRSMAIPIIKPPSPSPMMLAPETDVPDAPVVQEKPENDRDWCDETSVVVEPTEEPIDRDGVPLTEAAIWNDSLLKESPSEQTHLLAGKEKGPKIVETDDVEEVESVSETVIAPEPEYEPLPTESNSGIQSQGEEMTQSDGEESASIYKTEGKYDGESSLFLDDVPDTAVNDLAPNEIELPESESEIGSNLGKVVLVEAKSSPDEHEHRKDMKANQSPALMEPVDSKEVIKKVVTEESIQPAPTKVDPEAVEFKPTAETKIEHLPGDTNFKWEEEPISELEPKESATLSQSLNPTADSYGSDTAPAWDANENFESQPSWTDWSTNAGEASYTDADWDNRGRVPVAADEDSGRS